MTGPIIRLEFEFHEDTCNSDLTRLSRALDALEAQSVIVRRTQLGLTPEEASRWPNPREPFCVECSAGEHDSCERRHQIVGPERALAIAIYGEGVTECCCGAPG